MQSLFKQYHQFSEDEFKELWKNCIFVLDTNTLLNMYRYSRTTVNQYFEILNELREKNQLWIPYQVGYEFFENRPNVIFTLQKSYDEILSIIDDTKLKIDTKYKNHPFLDLQEIKKKIDDGLVNVIKDISAQKEKHPQWLKTDDVLKKINELFEGNVGNSYSPELITKICAEGEERYAKKIPPGFKDNIKKDNTKYGDLILWKQIIDKAKKEKKPIILISGDIKEDWWLEKDGQRIMPLPQLKQEMYKEANVDFHIYTSDKFLEHYFTNNKQKIQKESIDEIRSIREIEEAKIQEERLAENIKNRYENEHVPKHNRKYNIESYSNFFRARILYLMNKIEKIQYPKIFQNKIQQILQQMRAISINKNSPIAISLLEDLKNYIEASMFNDEMPEKNFDLLAPIVAELNFLLTQAKHNKHEMI